MDPAANQKNTGLKRWMKLGRFKDPVYKDSYLSLSCRPFFTPALEPFETRSYLACQPLNHKPLNP